MQHHRSHSCRIQPLHGIIGLCW